MTDWDLGEYEQTAERLRPAAEAAVAALAPRAGERVVDVACGTGNAALLAARAGASVLGVDKAQRLLAVAREAAAADGLDAEFAVADALAIPADDGAFDGAVSVFGVIFAPAEEAVRELLRVVRPGGRVVVTTWTAGGATAEVVAAFGEALGAPPQKPRWSDPDLLRELFAPHDVRIEIGELAFTAASPEAYVEGEAENHPMWLAVEPRLREVGKLEELRARTRAIYTEHNEDPSAFRTTSRYHLVTVTL